MIKTERRRHAARAIVALAAQAALSSACTPEAPPAADADQQAATPTATVPATPAPSTAARPPTGIDYTAMTRQLTRKIENGPDSLKAVRAVLVSVDGSTTLSYYQDRKPTEQAHIYSVTKSVVSILVGIAIDEGPTEAGSDPGRSLARTRLGHDTRAAGDHAETADHHDGGGVSQ